MLVITNMATARNCEVIYAKLEVTICSTYWKLCTKENHYR